MGPAFHRRQAAASSINVRGTALAVCALGLVALVFQLHNRSGGDHQAPSMLARMGMAAGGGGGGGGCGGASFPSCCRYVKPLPFVENRDAIGRVLEEEEMHVGVELGVQRGVYAETLLNQWTKCKRYILVRAAHQTAGLGGCRPITRLIDRSIDRWVGCWVRRM
jgi:hypothetical protein